MQALLHRILRKIVDVRAGEVGALFGSFAYFFCLLCGFYILRPVRDEMAITGGVKNLKWLFTGTFLVMLAAVPLYSAAVARWPRRRFIPIVYRFFAANLLVFFAVFQLHAAEVHAARAFFIWVSVYNLFVVSVFWGFMADLWRSEQGKRLFGFIAAGGSVGALVGPILVGQLAAPLGVYNLLLLSAVMLEIAAQCARRLARIGHTPADPSAPSDGSEPGAPGASTVPGATEGARKLGDERVGRGLWSGLRPVFRSPYLLGISGQTLLTTLTATVLYWQQMNVISAQIPDRAARTALFANIDLYTNLLSLAVQALVTGRVVRRMGILWALAAVPVVSAAGFIGLAWAPVIGVFVAFQVVRRAAHYGMERPGREMLFTVVRPEEKYTSKSFIDTVVYRGGDAASIWATEATAPVLGAAGLSLGMLPFIGAWLALNVFLARRQAERARERAEAAPGLP